MRASERVPNRVANDDWSKSDTIARSRISEGPQLTTEAPDCSESAALRWKARLPRCRPAFVTPFDLSRELKEKDNELMLPA